MKNLISRRRRCFPRAFTLIELLVVIAVIGMLAGMLLVIVPRVAGSKSRAVAYSELFQITAAIEAYKAKYGFYPPDNTNDVNMNPLYFELVGTVYKQRGSDWGYETLDGTGWIKANDLYNNFRVLGFANSATNPRGDDDRPAPVNFLKELKLDRIATNNNVRILSCSVGWDGLRTNTILEKCSWRYNSSHPTNNTGTFDLWVDLFVQDKITRFSNWSKTPQIIP